MYVPICGRQVAAPTDVAFRMYGRQPAARDRPITFGILQSYQGSQKSPPETYRFGKASPFTGNSRRCSIKTVSLSHLL